MTLATLATARTETVLAERGGGTGHALAEGYGAALTGAALFRAAALLAALAVPRQPGVRKGSRASQGDTEKVAV